MEDAIPEYVEPERDYPTVSRTKSDELTRPMYSLDHRVARQDGPPDFWEDEDTHVDSVIFDVDWRDC